MKIHLVRAVLAVVLLCGATAEAQYTPRRSIQGFEQGETLFALNYEISAPIGDFKNYLSNWSFRGFSGEGRYMATNRLSFGASFSWNRWEQTNTNANVAINSSGFSGSITGPLYRYADMFAVRALAHYYLMEGPIQPYLGVGIGGVWSYSYQQVVDLSNSKNEFNFIVDPEVGVLWEVMSGPTSLAVNLALRYTFTTAPLVNGGKNAQWLTLPVIGLAWSY
jgi:opacity protein-like surface antigen